MRQRFRPIQPATFGLFLMGLSATIIAFLVVTVTLGWQNAVIMLVISLIVFSNVMIRLHFKRFR